MTKRNNGAGSIFQRKDGKWVAAVWDPSIGKQIRKYAATKNKADAKLREMLIRIKEGTPATDKAITLNDYASAWALDRAGRRRSGSTVNIYVQRLDLYVLPVIGSKRLDKITKADVEDVLDSMAAKDLSRGTIKATQNALSALYSDAQKERIVAINPAHGAQLPLVKPSQKKIYPTTLEVKKLLNDISKETGDREKELGRILIVAMFTGARIGEILAMKWQDIDLSDSQWSVTRTTSRDIKGRQILGNQTKTKEVRSVALSSQVMTELLTQREYISFKRSMSGIWKENDFVFPTDIGTFKDANNLRRLRIKAYPDWKHGFHDLRHWFTSVAISEGLGEVQLARILGHRSTSTTKDVYSHLLDRDSGKAIDAVQRALKGKH